MRARGSLAECQYWLLAGNLVRVSTGEAPARKRVRLDYDDRHAQILSAARRLFCSRPYSEVSMSDLAEAAGVTRGLLHHYFGSKRDLYLAVVRQLIKIPAMPLPDARGLERESVWDQSVDGWMHLIEANRDLWLTAVGAGGVGRDPELSQILDEGREATAQRCLEALGISRADTTEEMRSVVRAYGGMVEEVTREWLERGRLTRAQARVLLRGALPLMIEQLLPDLMAAED